MSNKSRYVVVGVVALGLLSGVGYWNFLKNRPHPAQTEAPATETAPPATAATPDNAAVTNPKSGASQDMALGKPDAKVTVIEYASMTCPHCAHFNETDFPKLKQNFVDTGRVRYIFREFPLDGLALAASMVARCAGPDHYFAYIDLMYRNQKKWMTEHPKEDLAALVKLAGMGQAQFESCIANKDLQLSIAQTAKDGQGLYAIDSTPTLIVNGKKQDSHAYEDLEKAIKAAEAEAK